MTITFENKYGTVALTPVTEYMPISMVSAIKLPLVNDFLFSMEDGETIALITDNHNVQLSFPFLLNKEHPNRLSGYLMHHQSASVVCVCKVEINPIEIDDDLSAEQEIQRIYDETGKCRAMQDEIFYLNAS